MNRINIVGTSGTGKSTFAKKLAAILHFPYLEMDEIFWKPNWQTSNEEEFLSNLEQSVAGEHWVLDGNYHRSRPIKWAHVDTIIWLDYGFSTTLKQAIQRAFTRSLHKQELWGKAGNIETFSKSFFSRESVVLWTIKTFHSNRKRYEAIFRDPQYAHIKMIRLRSKKESQQFLQQIICG